MDSSNHHQMTPLVEKSNDLLNEGFKHQFFVREGKLTSSELAKTKSFDPQEIEILKHYRFEGTSDPGDMTILYAIETKDGEKGTLVDGFGVYADQEVGEFMQQVSERENQNNPKKD